MRWHLETPLTPLHLQARFNSKLCVPTAKSGDSANHEDEKMSEPKVSTKLYIGFRIRILSDCFEFAFFTSACRTFGTPARYSASETVNVEFHRVIYESSLIIHETKLSKKSTVPRYGFAHIISPLDLNC